MSHFAVAVITKTDSKKEIENLLAPYQENNMGDCPKEFLEFVECDAQTINRYKEDYSKEKKKVKKDYPTFEEYMEKYWGFDKDKNTNMYGIWENPNAKWDWYTIGGRFEDEDFSIFTKIKDINLKLDMVKYNEALRFWEVAIEGKKLNENENEDEFFTFYKPEYYIEQYKTKENYARHCASFSCWAILTPDGEWVEKGSMGWFACSDATYETRENFDDFFYNYLKNPANQEYYMTIIDCHI